MHAHTYTYTHAHTLVHKGSGIKDKVEVCTYSTVAQKVSFEVLSYHRVFFYDGEMGLAIHEQ